MTYRKFHECFECGHEWEDIWDCLCNDRCPNCNVETEPSRWEEIEDTGAIGIDADPSDES